MPRRSYSNVALPIYLVGTLDGSSSTNTITVSTTPGGGASNPPGWPASYPYFACIDPGTANEEIVSVTGGSSGTLTITRGTTLGSLAYGTATKTHQSSAQIVHVVTAAEADEANAHVNASTAVHGLASGSAVVGTADTQTLTNKTLGGGTIAAAVAHASGGLVVGTTATQTLTNKTLTSPTLTGGTADGGVIATTDTAQTLALKRLTAPTITGGTLSASTLADPTVTGTITAPVARLTSATDLTTTSTDHPLQIGPSTGSNLRMDRNEIMVLDNGVGANLNLQTSGSNGSTTVGGALFAPKKMQAGKVPITPVANVMTSANVTFPGGAFATAPIVTVAAETTQDNVQNATVSDITTTGCKVWVLRNNATTTSIHWIAMAAGG